MYPNKMQNHPKAQFWSMLNKDIPSAYTLGFDKKVWFTCDNKDCKHDFEIRVSEMTRGQWCPYCAKKKLCGNVLCVICFRNSFASSKRVAYWSPKNKVSPHTCFKSSGKKFWFNCDNDLCKHSFELRLADITRDDIWCPYCSNRKLCDKPGRKICYFKSFESHPRARF